MKEITIKIFKEIDESIIQSIIMNDYIAAATKIRGLLHNLIYSYLLSKGNRIPHTITFRNLLVHVKVDQQLGKLYEKICSNNSVLSEAIHFNLEKSLSEIDIIESNDLIKTIYNLFLTEKGLSLKNDFSSWNKPPEYFEIQNFINFIGKSRNLIIPRYQRKFVWTYEMVYNFIDSSNFISNLYITKGDDNVKDFYIVDGQQRIKATVLFFLWVKHMNLLPRELEIYTDKLNLDLISMAKSDIDIIFKNFGERFKNKNIVEILNKLLSRRYLINWVKWENQIKLFNSLNFSNVSLTKSELFIAWLIGESKLEKQNEIINSLDNFSGKLLLGISYEKFVNEIYTKRILHTFINWEAILKVIQYKFRTKYDLLIPNVNKSDDFVRKTKKIYPLLSYLFQNSIWNSIHSRVVTYNKNYNNIDDDIVSEYLFDEKILLELVNHSDSRFLKVLLISNTILNNNLFHNLFTNAGNTSSNEKWVIIITSFINILFDVNDKGHIIPSKFFKENHDILYHVIFNYVIGFDTNALMIERELHYGFMLTNEQNDFFKRQFQGRNEIIYGFIEYIVKDMPKKLDGGIIKKHFKNQLNEIDFKNKDKDSQIYRSLKQDDISDLQRFRYSISENLITVFSDDSFQRISNKFNPSISSFSNVSIILPKGKKITIFIILNNESTVRNVFLNIDINFLRDDISNKKIEQLILEDKNPNNFYNNKHILMELIEYDLDKFCNTICNKTKEILID